VVVVVAVVATVPQAVSMISHSAVVQRTTHPHSTKHCTKNYRTNGQHCIPMESTMLFSIMSGENMVHVLGRWTDSKRRKHISRPHLASTSDSILIELDCKVTKLTSW